MKIEEILTKLNYIENPIITDKNQIIGTIYCFINTNNGKLYIGKTVQANYTRRFTSHKSRANKQEKFYFYRALNKYGWNTFLKVVLYQTQILDNTKENKKLLSDLLSEKEVYYISKYNTSDSRFGYNLTSGGEGTTGFKFSEEQKQRMSETRSGENHWHYGKYGQGAEAILQFDLKFNLVKEWNSTTEIERELGFDRGNISKCCNNKIKAYKNFIWVKKQDYYEGYLQKYKSAEQLKDKKTKEVLQYDFLGKYINSYSSCNEASRSLNKRSSVSKAAAGVDPQAFNYIWIYKDDFSEKLLAEKLETVKNKCRFYTRIVNELLNKDNNETNPK